MSLRVFITGATGFVGSHLLKFLDSPEYDIYGTAFPEVPEREPKESKGRVKIFRLDVRSEKEVFKAVKESKPDWVIHLAAVSNVKHSWERREETLETNLMGTFYLLEALRKLRPQARVLFVSSSDVYGLLTPKSELLREEEPLQAVNPYAFTKMSGEILSRFYAQVEKMEIIIARSFPHTGPGQSPAFVCSDWACQIARIEKGLASPVIKIGNCQLKRDFTDVRDVSRAYVLLLQRGKSGEVYNVCSGRAVLLRDILDLLLSFSREKVKVEVDKQKLRRTEIPLLVGDNQKICQATSWQPQILLKKSLSDLLEYWRNKI